MPAKSDHDVLLAASAIEWHGNGIGDLVEDALVLLREIAFKADRTAAHGATIYRHTRKELKMNAESKRKDTIERALGAYRDVLEAAGALHEKLHIASAAVKSLNKVAPEIKARDPFQNWSAVNPRKVLELEWTIRDLRAALSGEAATDA